MSVAYMQTTATKRNFNFADFRGFCQHPVTFVRSARPTCPTESLPFNDAAIFVPDHVNSLLVDSNQNTCSKIITKLKLKPLEEEPFLDKLLLEDSIKSATVKT